ncbi:MAG: IclR family transcriptional regulator [Deltaproteobacteria bacterium]|nr:IclR family transcriptional regulator [Deltaproteobacteria bacterium]
MVKREKSRYIVQSVVKALEILEAFTDRDDELGVIDICNRLGLSKSNVSRLLDTLQNRGYIEQNKITGNYRLGLKSFEMGQIFFKKMGLLKQVRPVMEELTAQCDEAVYVAILHVGEVVYLDMVETTHSVRAISRVGWRLPAYCTAVGKAQLAFLQEDELERFLSNLTLKRLTANTITDKEKLRRHLTQVAEQGYAIDNEECEEEIRCVGVPIWDYTRRPVASICISGPSSRVTDERIQKELAALVKEAGSRVSRQLGYEIGISLHESDH